MKKESQQLPPYSLRLEPETRTKLEAIAKANGRSLNTQIVLMLEEVLVNPTLPLDDNLRQQLEEASREGGRSLQAEILQRLDNSLLSSLRVDWRQILDPAVYLNVTWSAEFSKQTIEEVINNKLLQAYDGELADLFLEDLSGEVLDRRMKRIEEMKAKGEIGEDSKTFLDDFGGGITMGQVLDERMTNAIKKRQDNPDEQKIYYPFYGLAGLNSMAIIENELFVRSIVRDELVKAGIKPVEEPK